MSEKDRMLAGELYLFEGDAELMEMGMRARRLTRLYNATREDEDQRRRELLEELLGAVAQARASSRRCIATTVATSMWGSAFSRTSG